MRKKHQAVHISTLAKKNFCNEISLGDYTYEEEIKGRLNDYFNDNIKDEDVEDNNENQNSDSDDDSYEFNKMKVPKQISNEDKEFAKFQISERAVLSSIEDYNYELIPKKIINIGEKEEEKIEENNRDIGADIKLEDIIKQYIYWKENGEQTDKKKCEIEPFSLFNLNADKIKMIKQKINEIKKIAKDKKMNDKMLNQFLKELDDCYSEQRKELNNLSSNMENVDTISYGRGYCSVNYKK